MNLLERCYKLINKYNQKNKTPKKYGTDDILFPAEVHMIEVIGSNHQITTTELADIMGVTKGAVSQITNKLEKKDMIVRETSDVNRKEVYLSLNEKGRTVYLYHRKMHEASYMKIKEALEGLSPECMKAINRVMEIIDDSLNQL